MKNSNRGFAWPLIIIVLLVLGGGFYSLHRYGKPNEKTMTTSSVSETDWHTYTNNEYGFQLILPEDWKGYEVNKKYVGGDDTGDYAAYFSLNFSLPTTTGMKDLFLITAYPNDEQIKTSFNVVTKIGSELARNKKFVFTLNKIKTPPADLDYESSQIDQIAKTFKLIN